MADACSLEIERKYDVIPTVICSMCCLFGIIYCFFGEDLCWLTEFETWGDMRLQAHVQSAVFI